jgi:hypothetical protein
VATVSSALSEQSIQFDQSICCDISPLASAFSTDDAAVNYGDTHESTVFNFLVSFVTFVV